jgi:hypothetical protein
MKLQTTIERLSSDRESLLTLPAAEDASRNVTRRIGPARELSDVQHELPPYPEVLRIAPHSQTSSPGD